MNRPTHSPEIDSALYLVPTPIGNLEDITLRAIRVLRDVDIVACEDTRTTGKLLSLLGVKANQLVALHAHNERDRAVELIENIKLGKSLAFCSDAGTPCISDPGGVLVQEAIQSNIKVIPLAGANALLTALIASGIDAGSFTFLGFPPHKKGRKTFFDEMSNYSNTVIVYESPYRIQSLADELLKRCPDRKICIARELTKDFEEFIRGSVSDVHKNIAEHKSLKGEFVVILQGKSS